MVRYTEVTVSQPCITRQNFDSAAFDIPFYRVQAIDAAGLAAALADFGAREPYIIDAKVPSAHLDDTRIMMELVFRRVCTQVELVHRLGASDATVGNSQTSDHLELPETELRAHAANFRYDRFSLDPLLPRRGIEELYYRWIQNSLGGRKRVVHKGTGFCTFAADGAQARIDLLSVLESGAGIGTDLLRSLIECCRQEGRESISVVTECENPRAWRLYQRLDFSVARYMSVFHYVMRSGAE